MAKKLCLLAFIGVIVMLASPHGSRGNPAQGGDTMYKDNSCVRCHAGILEPLRISSRYFEWHRSRHQEKGVSCDKCHGGDPLADEQQKAHAGIFRSSVRESRLHWKNQPETCNACHQTVVSSFVTSVHYQRLKGVGLGPSCNTCHAHMATVAIYSPKETANLCAVCHDSINFLPPRPEIPVRAEEVMIALQRATAVINWANLLLATAQRNGVRLDREPDELKQAEGWLKEAKVNWHTFNLDVPRKRADEAFRTGSKVRDGLRAKLSVH
jgi:hypothetical protein